MEMVMLVEEKMEVVLVMLMVPEELTKEEAMPEKVVEEELPFVSFSSSWLLGVMMVAREEVFLVHTSNAKYPRAGAL